MLIVRPAAPADEVAIRAVDDATWSAVSSPAPRPSATRSSFDHTDPANVLVAEEDGTVLGYVQLHNAIPLESHAHVLEINGLAVAPTATGRGIGAQLVEAAVAEAATRGALKVSLRVLAHNAGARRLYARCGFVEEGVLRAEFLLDGSYVDDVLMARFVAVAG